MAEQAYLKMVVDERMMTRDMQRSFMSSTMRLSREKIRKLSLDDQKIKEKSQHEEDEF